MGMAVVGPQDTNGGGRRHGDLPTTVRHGFASIATGRQCLPSDLKPQATINKLLMAVRKETNDSNSTVAKWLWWWQKERYATRPQ